VGVKAREIDGISCGTLDALELEIEFVF